MLPGNDMEQANDSNNVIVGWELFLTWMTTSILMYGFLSGLAILILPFGAFAQYSVLVHTAVGILSCVPICWLIYLHWNRHNKNVPPLVGRVAIVATALFAICILAGIIMSLQAVFGTWVTPTIRNVHLVAGLLLGLALVAHLVPIILRNRNRNTPASNRRPAGDKFAAIGVSGIAILFVITFVLAESRTQATNFQPFDDKYSWLFDDDRPFWPSQAGILNPPWQSRLHDSLRQTLDDAELRTLQAELANWKSADGGPITALRAAIDSITADDLLQQQLLQILGEAEIDLKQTGAIRPEAMTGSAGCGVSGCHETIYEEWLPSAHGFAATDVLFQRVQQILSDTEGPEHTRLCAGCHDPVALLSGTRVGTLESNHSLVTFEGNSCLVCHSTVSTVSGEGGGNGGYVLQIPDRYLFEQDESGFSQLLSHFLLRSYPYHHVSTYARPLYKTSEFCAACHKQTPLPGVRTSAGIAQEQNEYDSWREGRWYHEEDEKLRIECRECHMPLVDSDEPASGDEHDTYRSSSDGKHRSHRMLGSNMYIPVVQNLPGGQEQAEQTIAWLRGEREIPEIESKWDTGPIVEIEIMAPDEIKSGELVNLKLHLYNNKTGHEFPAGLLDVLESWVELTVEDNLGNVLMQLGNEKVVNPSVDAPVIYKADWYDSQGLPIERHKLWEVVGASYRRALTSGEEDIVDVPFRCPSLARPRLSGSASEVGAGERRSDVVLAIESDQITELRITARLLFRKANPEFLALIYDLEPAIEPPVIELNSASHIIKIVPE